MTCEGVVVMTQHTINVMCCVRWENVAVMKWEVIIALNIMSYFGGWCSRWWHNVQHDVPKSGA